MSPRTSYILGAPNWADLQTTHPTAAKEYSMAVKDDSVVAAIAPQHPEGSPSRVEFTAVAGIGVCSAGTLANGPIDTPIGAMAMLRDPQGGAFSIFTANSATS
jgi:hypothetical protein